MLNKYIVFTMQTYKKLNINVPDKSSVESQFLSHQSL